MKCAILKSNIGVFALALIIVGSAPAQEAASGGGAESRPVSNNEADAKACTAQLNIINNALRKYVDQHKSFPRWLSDLTPDYLANSRLLVCPYVYGSGNVKNWWRELKTFNVHNDPRPTSYGYEFCLEQVKQLPDTDCREYKQRQMEILGGVVPIVRCTAHNHPINLAYDGAVYRSGEDWEDLFAKSADDSAALQQPLPQSEIECIVRRLVRPRAANTNPRCVDLSTNYNATLFHLSNMEYDGKVIEMLTNGVYTIHGISFDVRGLVHLTATNFVIPFPQAVNGGIALNRQCARVHLLHGVVGAVPEGAIVARYVFHLQNGRKFETPIVYGKDVLTRFFIPEDETDSEKLRAAWITPSNRTGSSGRALRLYLTSWENPEPSVMVQSVDFISEMTASAPFLVAITTQ
jgi:hypothetical protein